MSSWFSYICGRLSIVYSCYMVATFLPLCIAGLHPQSPRHSAWQPSVRGSQTLRASYIRHVTAVTTEGDESWHFHRSDCRNTLINAHTTSRTLQFCRRPRLAKVTCASCCRICGFNPPITFSNTLIFYSALLAALPFPMLNDRPLLTYQGSTHSIGIALLDIPTKLASLPGL